MKNLITLFLLFGLVGFMGCNSDDDNKEDFNNKDETCNNITASNFQTITVGSETREYILHIPTSFDSNTPTPLVINFHGFGGCATDFATDVGLGAAGLNAVADNNNFIVAYPQGVVRAKESPEWDPGDSGVQNIKDNDIYFTEQLVNEISSNYNIDALRVYATGYSNGGMMAYGLACTKSDLIAAVGIMSGIMLEGTCNMNEYTSVIHFHGRDDDVLPLAGNQDFQPVSDVIDFWLDHNNIPTSSVETTELNNGDVFRDVYTGGHGNTSFTIYTVNSEHDKPGGHVWFTGEIDGVSPNQVLWDFLSSFRLDD